MLKYIFSLNHISLESTKINVINRMLIRNNIINLYYELKDLIKFIDATIKNQKRLLELQKELEKILFAVYVKFLMYLKKNILMLKIEK